MTTYVGSEGVINLLTEIFASPPPKTGVKICEAIYNLDILNILKPEC